MIRKLDRKTKEVKALTSKIRSTERQSLSLSYGLRLLKTASGSRNNSVNIDISGIENIPEICISQSAAADSKIGEGRFGSCRIARYHEYNVCIKTIDRSIDLQHVLKEAYFLHAAGSHKCIPHLFGVLKSKHAIVMSYHSVNGTPISMYEAFCQENDRITSCQWVVHILTAAQTILHIHERNILHNDIKIDNFVFGTSCTMSIEPILVDFGKACFLGQGKNYKSLTSSEREEYKLHHPHLAPDLRDGLCEQAFPSDVYSFGYLLYTLAKKKDIGTKRNHLKALSKECMSYNADERPEMRDVVCSLTEIVKI